MLVLPLVLLAAVATVIASQALISGVYSLTRQASQLGLWPRVKIVQTSSEGYGQIYVPVVNWSIMLLTVAVALIFKTSDDLAAAYGIAVSGTMLITTILLYEAMRVRWQWRWILRVPLTLLFVGIDFAFLAANLVKLPDGGWLPLAGGFCDGEVALRQNVRLDSHAPDAFQLFSGRVLVDFDLRDVSAGCGGADLDRRLTCLGLHFGCAHC